MKPKLLPLFCLLALFTACSGSDDSTDVSGNNEVSNTLHLSFRTPEWDKFINCELLDLYGYGINETTNYVSATSAFTKETFYFSIPKDSSVMVKAENIKKYAITEYGQNENPFEFSQKVPVTEGSQNYLVSLNELSDNSYNEVVSIAYAGSESNFALFKVKCRYQMKAYEIGNETNIKSITGTFHFKVRTSKD